MAKEYKVNVRHFVNNNQKPITKTLKETPNEPFTHDLNYYYNIWYFVTYRRLSTTLKSHVETIIDDLANLSQFDQKLLLSEKKALETTILYFAARHPDFTIKGQKELLSFYAGQLRTRIKIRMAECLKNRVLNQYGSKLIVKSENERNLLMASLFSISDVDPEYIIDYALFNHLSKTDFEQLIHNEREIQEFLFLKMFYGVASINSIEFAMISVADWELKGEKARFIEFMNSHGFEVKFFPFSEYELTSFGKYSPLY